MKETINKSLESHSNHHLVELFISMSSALVHLGFALLRRDGESSMPSVIARVYAMRLAHLVEGPCYMA